MGWSEKRVYTERGVSLGDLLEREVPELSRILREGIEAGELVVVVNGEVVPRERVLGLVIERDSEIDIVPTVVGGLGSLSL